MGGDLQNACESLPKLDGFDPVIYSQAPKDDLEDDLEELHLTIDNPWFRDLYETSHRFQMFVYERDLDNSAEYWEYFVDYVTGIDKYSDYVSSNVRATIRSLLNRLLMLDATKFYVHSSTKESKIIIPKLVLDVSTSLSALVANDPQALRRLSPREFEKLIAEIFNTFGYHVELTARTRDGGRDVVAVKHQDDILYKLLIECKRYSPHRKVGVAHVRELYAVKTIERATKAILATTSMFTADARRLEQKLIYELELKDKDAIVNWALDARRSGPHRGAPIIY
jgi:HJR/Mrr/RecB family endonuclease